VFQSEHTSSEWKNGMLPILISIALDAQQISHTANFSWIESITHYSLLQFARTSTSKLKRLI
jgi:hypothetical protein